ncbi:MAG: Flp pilus assembly complex ATPase component TadA [bacterium]|nr:Flp pilus assembly complex ATPase component TadA [bacterium]
MKFDDKIIKEILLKGNYISKDDLEKAENYSKTQRESFIDYLLQEGIISRDILGMAIAESLGVNYVELSFNKPDHDQIFNITEKFAKKFRAVFFRGDKSKVIVTTDDPTNKDIKIELENIFPGKTIEVAYSLSEDIDNVLLLYKKDLETKFARIIANKRQVAPEILFTIFEDATVLNVSDIHFEPISPDVLIRFRIDGVLRDAGRISKELYENILNRIKVLSGMRLDEHLSAQDGAMQSKFGDIVLNLRVSVVPTVEGEKAVLRVLSSYIQGLVLGELGLSKTHRDLLEEVANKPFGMIMVTGPTGSGKTTTLYALLKILNKSDVNITTIEDPVEYKMRGINQIQVNSVTDLTFAKGLRSIVRQDPDIILVGEIRDNETAEIAVNAALTGHLLLSTFHSNDASTAIPRLLDMGIEPFLLASTLNLIVAQRLARKICQRCKQTKSFTLKEIKQIHPTLTEYFKTETCDLYVGKGCDECGQTGYKGRIALFEIIEITSELQELILKNPSSKTISDLARTQGTHPMFEDGIEKVKNGVTTLTELLRVVEPPLMFVNVKKSSKK